ncbi:MAG: adenosylhomocysteinase, partial [Proteobacteria bacterium]|nr:adenosylhomocysteinase [Pseudomonadota bacterium]
PLRRDAIASADVIVTVTGFPGVLTTDDMDLLKTGVILINGGHFPHEIDVAGLRAHPLVVSRDVYAEQGIETLQLKDGRAIHILGGGHMANLAGPRPLGNSVESMDLGFTLQAHRQA